MFLVQSAETLYRTILSLQTLFDCFRQQLKHYCFADNDVICNVVGTLYKCIFLNLILIL